MLSIDQLNNTVGDIQRNYLFKVMCPVYPAALLSRVTDAVQIASNMDVYTTNGDIPESSNTPIEVKWAGEKAWFSGPNDAAMSTELKLRMPKDWKPYKFFKGWKDLTGSDATQAALPKPLTLGTIAILTIDVDKTTVLYKVELRNAQVLKVSSLELDKAGDGEATFTATVHYERKVDFTENLGTV